MESCGRYIVLVMTFEVATHFLKCISCSITPQTPGSRWQRRSNSQPMPHVRWVSIGVRNSPLCWRVFVIAR